MRGGNGILERRKKVFGNRASRQYSARYKYVKIVQYVRNCTFTIFLLLFDVPPPLTNHSNEFPKYWFKKLWGGGGGDENSVSKIALFKRILRPLSSQIGVLFASSIASIPCLSTHHTRPDPQIIRFCSVEFSSASFLREIFTLDSFRLSRKTLQSLSNLTIFYLRNWCQQQPSLMKIYFWLIRKNR